MVVKMCIVNPVGEFSYTVVAWDTEYTIRIDYLKLLNYLDSESKQMQLISDGSANAPGVGINRLQNNGNFEEAAYAVLKHLEDLKRPYLTKFEEEILALHNRGMN